MITVLIVEDSPVIAEFLRAVLGSDPAIHVVGVAPDGEAAVEAARRLRQSVITMDIPADESTRRRDRWLGYAS